MIKNTKQQFGSVAKWLHWLTAILIITLLTVGFFMDEIGDKALKGQVYNLHKSFGLTLLLLGLVRITWASMNVKPGYSIKTPMWQQNAAKALHYLLYGLIIAMPISGWIMSTAAGHAPNFFGLMVLPFPGIPESKPLMEFFAEIHEFLAWAIIVSVAVHIAAALKHHFVEKDDVLIRMLPRRKLPTDKEI